MPKLVDILLKEVSYKGRDSKELDTILKGSNITTSAAYFSARRGRPTADQRDLASKAGTKSRVLLEEFGISSVSPNPIPEVAIKNLITSLLSGTKREEFEELFKRDSVRLIKHGSKKQLAIYIGLTEVSQMFIKKHEAIKKEYAYWIYSIVIAAEKAYGILNKIKLEGQLKVDHSQSSYIIYLSRRSWSNI